MKRIVFLPDRSVEREGDLFHDLVEKLGLKNYEIDGDEESADFVAYVGRDRAEKALGERVKTGPVDERTYVLPSTAPEHRGRFYEGVWRSFASHVLGKDLAVRDEYKGLAPEEVKRRLDEKRFPFAILAANVAYDFNIGSIIRSANAFLAKEIVIFGRKKTDLRGAMGSYIYENLVHVDGIEALNTHIAKRNYALVCFEETKDAIPLADFAWPPFPMMAFGQEGPGLPEELRERADHTVLIPQFGSIRSLNVGVAAGIAMYDWHAKYGAR